MICTAHPILFDDQIQKNEIGGACRTYRDNTPEGKTQIGSPRRRWEDNIKMYPQEVLW
jgi:hypothetical protein